MKKYLLYINTILLSMVVWSFYFKNKNNVVLKKQQYELSQDQDNINVENTELSGKFGLKSNAFRNMSFDYKGHQHEITPLLQIVWLKNKKEINDSILWKPNHNTLNSNKPLILSYKDDDGIIFMQSMQIIDKYFVKVECSVFNSSDKDMNIRVDLRSLLNKNKFVGHTEKSVIHKQLPDRTNYQWYGMSSDHWGMFIAPDKNVMNAKYTKESDLLESKFASKNIKSKESSTWSFNLFLGPKDIDLLKQYDQKYNIKDFENSIDYGRVPFILKPLTYILHYLNKHFNNFVVTILIFTFAIKLLFTPLDYKAHIAAVKLAKLQPTLDKIKEQYKGDNMAIHAATLALYKQESINPLGGCLPLLLQMPILFPLYHVFSSSLAAKYSSFLWIKDLALPDKLSIMNCLFGKSFIIDLSVISVIFTFTMFLQLKKMSKMNKSEQSPLVLATIFALFTSQTSSGFLLYMIVSNILSYIQKTIFDVIISKKNEFIH